MNWIIRLQYDEQEVEEPPMKVTQSFSASLLCDPLKLAAHL